MGLFDFGRRNRAAATLDTATGELRRTALAEAVERARNPPPAPRKSGTMAGFNAARMMTSGDVNRLTGDWPTMPVPADWIVQRFQRVLVARSREQAHNNDFMKAYLRLNRLNIVGPNGILLQSLAKLANGKPDVEGRLAVENAFADWGLRQHCDVAGKLSWPAMQRMCVESMARDGEFFVRIVTGRKNGGKYNFALQLLDAQRCPVDLDRSDMPDGVFIRHGIEFNAYGRPLAYYFRDDSAERGAMSYSYSGRSFIRISADEIIHGFVAELPGQKRGFPWMATGLFRAKQTSAMEDAAVVNARVGAAKMGFVQFKEGSGPEWDDDEGLELDAEAGAFPVLPSGAEFKEFNPQYPSGEFAPFVKQMLRGFAAGGGVSYPSLSQDLEGVNFSSIRHGELDARETYKERQAVLIDELCRVVFPLWLKFALLTDNVVTEAGVVLRIDRLVRLLPQEWQGRRWTWIDPHADSAAAESSKNNLLKSPGALIREGGEDPMKVWREFGEDIAAMRAAGIPDEIIALSMGQKVAPKPESPAA